MSALVMGRVFYADLPGHLKLCLLALADHAHDDGTNVFPGQARLAEKTSTAIRTVHDNVKELVVRGYLVREGRIGREGGRGPVRYRIIVDLLPIPNRQPTAERQNLPSGSPPPIGDRQPAVDRTANRQPTATEPSVTVSSRQPSWSYVESDFVTFWEAYPRRDGRREKRAEAVAEWKRLRPDPALRTLLLRRIRAYGHVTDKPVDACRYLKHRRWEDDIDVPVAKRVPVAGASVADFIPDEKPVRSREEVAHVKEILDRLPFLRNRG